MSDFGDYEPEDAWHPDDPLVLLIENLHRRLDLLDHADPRPRLVDAIDHIELRLAPWLGRRGTLSQRDELRVEDLQEDLALLRSRSG